MQRVAGKRELWNNMHVESWLICSQSVKDKAKKIYIYQRTLQEQVADVGDKRKEPVD